MFKRYASATVLEKISLAQAKKIVHAEDDAPVSFPYDPSRFTYFRCRAITADEPNGNGDLFPDEHLRKSYKTFVGVGLYKDHDSDSIDKAIGKVLWAEYIEPSDGHAYVETICAVDKQLAPDLARRVESGIATSVSMGCGRAGTKITMRDGTLKNIESVLVGDEVMTHAGVPSRVTSLFKRDYTDPIYKIGVAGLTAMPLYITAEHPVWSVSKEQIKKIDQPEMVISGRGAYISHLNNRIDTEHDYRFSWTKVEDLRIGDYVGFPFSTRVDTPDYVTRDFARLGGYYLAEGNFTFGGCGKKRSGICLTFNINEKDTFAAEAAALVGRVFGRPARIKELPHLRAIRVFGYGTEIADRFYSLFGSGARTKRLHESVLYWDKPFQLELVGAFINGDGFATSNHKLRGKREIDIAYLETASHDLARQMCTLLSRSGVIWNIEQKDYPDKVAKSLSGEKIVNASRTWRVCFTKRYFNQMSRYSAKIPGDIHPMGGRDVKFFYKNYLMSPIRSIELEEYNEPVYNFEVENQNSYLMNGFAVHNCSVREAECSVEGCHNVARNPNELCQHMMPGFGIKGRKNHDGTTVYEINRDIQFTELSLVTVPADPTARIFEVYAQLEKRKASISRADFITELVKIAESASAEQMETLRKHLHSSGLTYENVLGAKTNSGVEAQNPVERKDKLGEQTMGLSISYVKGSSLGTSFFIARDAAMSYRVAASDVLPIVVQKSIEGGDAGVITPERLISDLTQKYASVGDFKAWAKRRRKKNRIASAKAGKECKDKTAEEKAETIQTAMPQKTEEAAKPAVDGLSTAVKASSSDNGRSEMNKTANEVAVQQVAEVPAVAAIVAPVTKTPAPVKAAKPEDKTGEIFAAFDALRKYVESKLGELQKREAVKTESNVGKSVADGEHKDHAVNVATKGVEDPKTESPKGHMDKCADLKVEAMDKDWSVNPKELEKAPKVTKATDNMPAVVSLDRKEMSSEAVDTNAGGKAGSNIKKLMNRLPSNGPGEAPQALDAKSAQDPEKEMLRKALSEEKAKVAAAAEKERLQSIADKVFEVVTAMKEKNLFVEGKEDAVIDTLTARFADINQLENLKTLVAHLNRKADAIVADAVTDAELPVGRVVPQVFETVENTEDAVLKMASIWNR